MREAIEAWDEHLRPREGESNEAYWQCQRDWTNAEAAKLDMWLAGAKAGLAVSGIRSFDEIPPRTKWQAFWHRCKQIINYPDSLRVRLSDQGSGEKP